MHEKTGPWVPLEALPEERRWLWLVVAAWSAVCFGGGLVDALRPGSWRARGLVPGFFQDYASARNFFAGTPIYTKHDATLPLYLGSGARRMATPVVVNAHPPPSVLLVLPLARLQFDNALFVWNLVSLVTLVVSLRLVQRGLRIPLSVWSLAPLTSLVVTCAPLLEQIRQGQQSLALLLLLTGAWSADRSGRDRLAGCMIGAATAIKLFPGFLLLYYAWRRRWRVVAAGFIVLAALCFATVAILGAESFRD
ncbi:MAG: glycosyltransferase family 87 protein, partial [Isosphaeraceae bacterium]